MMRGFPFTSQITVPGDRPIFSGGREGVVDEDFKQAEALVIEAIVQRALELGIATTRRGLVVRDIFVDKDFLDGTGAAITDPTWKQPASGNYAAGSNEVVIYKIGPATKYDRKIYAVYGVRAANQPLYDRLSLQGTNVLPVTINAARIIFKKGTAKIIAQVDLQRLETDPRLRLLFNQPIVFEKNEEGVISFLTKASTAAGSSDNLILLGKVVEPVGENVVG